VRASRGGSWEAIGRLLAVSPPAAQQGFATTADGRVPAPADDGSAAPERRAVAVGTWSSGRYFKRVLDAPAEADTDREARYATGTSPPRANGGTRAIRSPLQKRPGSYHEGGRPAGSRPIAW
jgi:hypothetical protein